MLNNRGLERGYKELLKYHHDSKDYCLLMTHTKNNKNMTAQTALTYFCIQGC